MDRAEKKRVKTAQVQREAAHVIRDRRRFKISPVSSGEIVRRAPENADGTIFKNQVKTWTPETKSPIFKPGTYNTKIGGDVLVGDVRGAKIFTLSLEERKTCPSSCFHWRSCYGNNMQYATRWAHSDELLAGMAAELKTLCAKNHGVLIRLHVLGDFYSAKYVNFWDQMLRTYNNLFCFGFTAHKPDTDIGEYVAEIRDYHEGNFAMNSRFAIRHSGMTGRWGSFTIDFPSIRKRYGDAVVCPEQVDADINPERQTHCGSCAVCWQTDAPIIFREH